MVKLEPRSFAEAACKAFTSEVDKMCYMKEITRTVDLKNSTIQYTGTEQTVALRNDDMQAPAKDSSRTV